MAYPFSPPQVNYGMANQANTFMQQQARLPYAFNLPNYGGMLGQRSKNIGGLLKGEVPTDVLQQIQQSGAERGVATGMPGSPNANASWLRALGLTSLGLQQQGSKEFSQAIADTPVFPLWSPLSSFVPQESAYAELQTAKPRTPWSGTQTSPWGGFSEGQNLQATGSWW